MIPAELRVALDLRAGTRIAIQRQDKQLVLQPINEEFIDNLMGCCKGAGLVEAYEREHRQDE